MVSNLDEARLKLRRGKEHLYMLESESRQFWDSNVYTLIHERNGEEFPNLLRFKMLKPPPQHRWGLILGDAVHNTRSALDYIAWRLAGSDLSDRYIQFPICESSDQWKRFQWRFEKGNRIHPDAFAYIRSVQPYLRPNPKIAKLWLLQELDARDKHKLITMTQVITRAAHIGGSGQILIPYAAVESNIEDGAVIIEYADPPEACMNMEIKFAFRVTFERGLLSDVEDIEVGACLYPVFEAVDIIIDNFESRLDWFPS